MKKTGKRRLRRALLITSAVVLLLIGAVALYAADYYHADDTALAALATNDEVTVQQTADGLAFIPAEPRCGFIFYPGGKVEHTAYAPLMHALAQQDVLCVLTDMPLKLAVLDVSAAAGIPEKYPQVTRWSIGGHSLGGAMAASYAAKHPDAVDALVLLAAYATDPLPDSLQVVSVYGTADGVLDLEKYADCRPNLPDTTLEVAIPGGNHAQFGSYGQQEGDGQAAISPDDQLAVTVEAILPALLGTAE